MPLRPFILLLIALLFSLTSTVDVVAGEVSGSVLYGAGQYRAESDGQEVSRIGSQYGQASVKYRDRGIIASNRFGHYTLMLGYEFNIIDPSVVNNGLTNPAAEQIKTSKILYQGDITLAPGGLPFRLNIFARDIHASTFVGGWQVLPDLPLGIETNASQAQKTLLTPDIVTEIENGQRKEFGALLLLGIRNGSYLGAYRDVLSQLPKILIDYRQIDVKDLASDSNQQHYRDRHLAFISLNKKDNWIHVRRRDYTDFLDQKNNMESSQALIGTIDQTLSRQWINLTNWIKISGDLSYNVDKRKNDVLPENSYRANLFTVTTRPEFQVQLLSTFERRTVGGIITQEMDIPLYFNYEPNRESKYRGRLIGNFYRQSSFEALANENSLARVNTREVTFDLSSELFRTRAVVIKPSIIVGVSENDDWHGFREKLSLELSNQKSRSTLFWTAGYSIQSMQTSNASDDSSVSFEQSLYGNVTKSLSRTMSIGMQADVRNSSGMNEGRLFSNSSTPLRIDSTGQTIEADDDFIAYNGKIFLDQTSRIFSNRLEFSLEGVKSDAETLNTLEVQHMLKMSRQTSDFSLTSSLLSGTGATVASISSNYVTNAKEMSKSGDLALSTKAVYNYNPDRRFSFSLNGSASRLSQKEGETILGWMVSESLSYRFYKRNGFVRKLAEITQEFGVDGGSRATASARSQAIYLRMMAAVYPTKFLYTKVNSELVLYNGVDWSEQMMLNFESGVSFEKLLIAFNCGRSYKAAEGALADSRENYWNLKFKKTF